MYQIDASVRARFLAKIRITPGCWDWTASKGSNGYGLLRVKINGVWRRGLAHRVAYEVFTGQSPGDGVVMHRCDNPGCVRPDHLKLGTQSENILDMDRKGRRGDRAYRRGETHHAAKLTDDQVREILALSTGDFGNQALLARRFGVSTPVIERIVAGKGWKHVDRAAIIKRPDEAPRIESWSNHPDGCVECGTKDRRHKAHGRCTRCEGRRFMALKRAQGYIAPSRREH